MQIVPRFLKILGLLGLLTGLYSCSLNHRVATKVNKQFKESAIVKQYHVGFALYNPENKQMIYEKDADKYFTPASNTKLFTFYAGLKMIPDSIPSLRYIEKGDSLIFWGTGDPSFLQPELKGVKAYEFLRNTNKKLFFAAGRYSGDFYGNGWQWDDYNEYYQAEINEMPIMGNLLDIKVDSTALSVSPRLFKDCFVLDSLDKSKNFRVKRVFEVNQFHYPNTPVPANYSQQVPYKINTTVTLGLLADTLHKHIELIHMDMPANAKTIYNMKTDSVLKAMMLPSDNFIAEQLLLVYSNQISTDLSTSKAIQHIEKTYLSGLPDKPRWVDGSGLSRGDLFTPRSIIALLDSIYKEVHNQKKLFAMIPAGGKSGTLRNAYPKTNDPFVFGKTGTLSNTHNQSGYVVTKKGKLFYFSFMNNSYVLPTATIRAEMVRIMTYIHDNF